MTSIASRLDWESSLIKDYLELFKSFEHAIPPVFWQILKVARVIRTEQIYAEQLNKLWQKRLSLRDEKAKEALAVPIISSHDPSLIVRQIKGLDELNMVDSTDMALYSFDDLCLQADEQKLLVRDLDRKSIEDYKLQIKPVGVSASKRLCLNYDQKLYLLLDRSFSMKELHRLIFAKALLIEYFRLKRGSNAQLFFRGFDFKPAQLFVTKSLGDYEKVLKELIFSQPAGKGTDIDAALKTAIHDIKYHSPFREAEVLLVTDCLGKIDTESINKEKENIKIHIVKIGREEQEPDTTELKELAAKDLLLEKSDVKRLYSEKLRLMFKEVSELFLEIDDIDASLLQPDENDLDFVQREVEFLESCSSYDEMQAIELFKRTATLLDFCYLMLDEIAQKSEMSATVEELSGKLESLLNEFAKKVPEVDMLVDGLMPTSKRSRWKRWLARRSLKAKLKQKKSQDQIGEVKISLVPSEQYKKAKRINIFKRLLAFIRKLFPTKKV